MIGQLIQVAVSLLLGAGAFGLARYLEYQTLISVVIGAAVSTVSYIVTLASGALDLGKTWLEFRKLFREVGKLDREEQDRNSLVQLPTREEIETYGASHSERKLRIHLRLEEEKDALRMKTFLSDYHESK